MKKNSTMVVSMEKSWTDDYLNGRWSNLLNLSGSEVAESFSLRAQIMAGNFVSLPSIKTSNNWIKINHDICRAHIGFVQARYAKALYYANRAYLRARKILPELLPDASFYRALCLSELGLKYEALALYSQIRQVKRITPYRKNLALTNEAWLLWDLGMIEPLKVLAPEIPEPFGSRIRLMLELLEGDATVIEKNLLKLPQYMEFPQNEKENIFLLLTEGILVFGNQNDLQKFKSTLFFADVVHSNNSPVVRFVCSILTQVSLDILLEGRDVVDGLFIQALWLLQIKSEEGKLFYKDKVLSILGKERIYSPFIPTESSLVSPRNNWERMLASKMFQAVKPVCIELDSVTKSLVYKENSVTFKKSPVTWKLISEFFSRRSIKKEDIHAILTSNRYNANLHDARIFKLVQRINSKTKKEFGFEVCQFNGNNELEINCELKRKIG